MTITLKPRRMTKRRKQLQKMTGDEFFAQFGEKLCKGCLIIKPFVAFPFNPWSRDGRASHCHDCYEDYLDKRLMYYEK